MSKYPGRIVSNLAPAGYSVYFDGTGDSLTISASGVGPTGTETFCFEVWMNASNLGGMFPRIFEGNATNAFQVYLNGGTLTVSQNGGSIFATYALTGLTNQWLHICVTRDSANSQLRLFINGVLRGYTASGGANFASTSIWQSANEGGGIVGYLSNMRVVRGSIPVEYQTSVTTTGTAVFTPPTQLFNITNTSLLTCNSPAIIDQSNNAFAITVNGNSAVSTLTPFTAYVPYNPALGASTPGVWTLDEALQAAGTRQWNMYDPYFNLTTLLLHGNGANNAQNNTFLDSSSNNFTISRFGNTTQGSFSPFSQTGWSNFFGSSTANLKFASNAAFAVGNSNFTVECFVNFTAWASTNQRIFVQGQSGTDNLTIQRDSGANNLIVNIQGSSSISYAWSPNIGQWYHIAVVKSGTGTGQVAVYIDGVSVATGTSSTSISQNQVLIGGIDWASSYNMQGYISNLRYTIGAALYTSNFTPSTTPLTTTSQGATASQVELLTCQSNSFIDNSSNGFSMTVNGTTSVQAFSPFYSTTAYTPQTIGGSGFFDGTGDYLVLPASSAFDTGAGTSDVTFECWVYNNGFSGSQYGRGIFVFYKSTDYNNNRLMVRLDSGSNTINCFLVVNGAVQFGVSGTNSTRLATPFAWTHVALVRSSQTFRLYINGVLDTTLAATTASLNGFDRFEVGRTQDGSVPDFNGNISGFRYLKGTAQYTSAFTPPTAPLTAITNTQLLLNFTNAGIVDSAADNVLETVGDAKISTAVSKFGGSSMYFDGTGDSLLLPSSPIRALGTADFTIEFWFNASSIPTFAAIIDMRNPNTDNAGFDIMFYFNKLAFGTATFPYITGVTTLSTGTWYHYALTRSGNVFRQFLNGVQEGSTYTGSSTQNFTNTILRIANGSNGPYTGYLDDIRITRGAARYTGNFTPQTSQWQDQ